jgi:hypothetical protein
MLTLGSCSRVSPVTACVFPPAHELAVDVLIGADWLTNSNVHLDFARRTIGHKPQQLVLRVPCFLQHKPRANPLISTLLQASEMVSTKLTASWFIHRRQGL